MVRVCVVAFMFSEIEVLRVLRFCRRFYVFYVFVERLDTEKKGTSVIPLRFVCFDVVLPRLLNLLRFIHCFCVCMP